MNELPQGMKDWFEVPIYGYFSNKESNNLTSRYIKPVCKCPKKLTIKGKKNKLKGIVTGDNGYKINVCNLH